MWFAIILWLKNGIVETRPNLSGLQNMAHMTLVTVTNPIPDLVNCFEVKREFKPGWIDQNPLAMLYWSTKNNNLMLKL